MARALAVCIAFALTGPVVFRPIWDGDAGWHLAVGRLIAERGIPHTNALSWTAPDHPWYPTNWLYDLLGHLLAARLGPLGVQLLVAGLWLLALAAWSIALGSADRRVGPWLLPAAALLLVPRLTHRPHVATWAALAAVIALGLPGRGRSTWFRFAMVPVLALAGNFHAGTGFAIGVAGLFCLEEFARTRKRIELLAAAACGLSLLVNPGGVYNAWYLIDNLSVQSVVSISELLPGTPANMPLLWIVTPLALAAGIFARRRIGWALTASFAVLAVLAFRSSRVGYDAFVCAAPLVAAGLGELRPRLGPRGPALLAALATAAVALGMHYDRWLPPHISATWNANRNPVRAADFVRQAGLDGRRFNGFYDGGYLEFALPAQKSFADARVQAWPASFWHDFQRAERTAASFQAWLDALGVEWGIATRTVERLAGRERMNGHAWALVYWDPISEVWVRRSVPRFRELIEALEYRYFRPYGSIVGQLSSLPREAIPRFLAEVERYERTAPEDPFPLLVRCGLASRAGSPQAAAICAAAEASESLPVRALAPRAKAIPKAAP